MNFPLNTKIQSGFTTKYLNNKPIIHNLTIKAHYLKSLRKFQITMYILKVDAIIFGFSTIELTIKKWDAPRF